MRVVGCLAYNPFPSGFGCLVQGGRSVVKRKMLEVCTCDNTAKKGLLPYRHALPEATAVLARNTPASTRNGCCCTGTQYTGTVAATAVLVRNTPAKKDYWRCMQYPSAASATATLISNTPAQLQPPQTEGLMLLQALPRHSVGYCCTDGQHPSTAAATAVLMRHTSAQK